MKWSCYRASRAKNLALKPLGYVDAPRQLEACQQAARRWPDEKDNGLPHGGFIVRVYETDPFSLGPGARKAAAIQSAIQHGARVR